MDLTDAQWAVIEPLIPKRPARADGKGRPRCPDRVVLNGILWVMRTGAQWEDLPSPRYPSKSTCHKRFQEWVRSGVFEKVLKALARDLKRRGKLDLSECFIDATFVSAKKGEPRSARRGVEKAAKSWQSQTALVFLSPFTYRLLRRLKSPSLNRLLQPVLSRLDPAASSATEPTIVTDMMLALLAEALN